MYRVWSSSSISTMEPQLAELHAEGEGTVEFDLSIEEEFPSCDRRRLPKLPMHPEEHSPSTAQLDQMSIPQCQMLPKRIDYQHKFVPKSVDLASEYSTRSSQVVTTLMIRNIPNCYYQRDFVAELGALGFGADSFDFLYLPIDNGTRSNVGYAFINFVSGTLADKCMHTLHNYRFKKHRKASGKIAAVSVAHIQGLEANLAHYEKATVNKAKNKQRRPLMTGSRANTSP